MMLALGVGGFFTLRMINIWFLSVMAYGVFLVLMLLSFALTGCPSVRKFHFFDPSYLPGASVGCSRLPQLPAAFLLAKVFRFAQQNITRRRGPP